MNNIMDHFATVFFNHHLKGDQEMINYLDLIPDGAHGVYAEKNGKQGAEHTYWKGFDEGTAVGLKLEHLQPGQ